MESSVAVAVEESDGVFKVILGDYPLFDYSYKGPAEQRAAVINDALAPILEKARLEGKKEGKAEGLDIASRVAKNKATNMRQTLNAGNAYVADSIESEIHQLYILALPPSRWRRVGLSHETFTFPNSVGNYMREKNHQHLCG